MSLLFTSQFCSNSWSFLPETFSTMDSSLLILELASAYMTLADGLAVAVACRRFAQDSYAARLTVRETKVESTYIGTTAVQMRCSLAVFRRHLASKLIQRFFRVRRQRLWLDDVARSVPRLHAFPNRLSTNFSPWRRGFSGGVAAVPRMLRTTRFTPRAAVRWLCGDCDLQPISAAIYIRVGWRMRFSHPVVHVGCPMCCLDFVELETAHADDTAVFLRWHISEKSWDSIPESAIQGSSW